MTQKHLTNKELHLCETQNTAYPPFLVSSGSKLHVPQGHPQTTLISLESKVLYHKKYQDFLTLVVRYSICFT